MLLLLRANQRRKGDGAISIPIEKPRCNAVAKRVSAYDVRTVFTNTQKVVVGNVIQSI